MVNGFAEDAKYLINNKYYSEMKGVVDQMMTNKMIINLNVLSALMKNIIVNNLNDTLTIIIDVCSFKLRDSHILQQPSKPEKAKSSVYKRFIFCFYTQMRKD